MQAPAMNPCHIEFAVVDDAKFGRLATVFEAIRHAKQADNWHDDEFWLGFFDQTERAHFWWPSDAELEDWRRRWFSTPAPERFTDPSLPEV